MKSVLIRNGRLIDGTGAPWQNGDILLAGGDIAAMGWLPDEKADMVIDAAGRAVAPGFIDIHTHSDAELMVDGRGCAHIMQGVTTEVIGNCGASLTPVTDGNANWLQETWGSTEGIGELNWRTLGDYLLRLENQGISINVAPLTGHGMLRRAVMGCRDEAPSRQEMEDMKRLLRQAMADGAFGLSSGLIYVPGSYAETGELIELARVAADCGGIYTTHIRGESDMLIAAVAEAIEIGAAAGIPVETSHFKAMGRHMWGKSRETLRMVEEARLAGVDVTCDQYPYTASATGLAACLPGWAHVGGDAELVKRLRSPESRARIKEDILRGTGNWISLHKGVGWENIFITGCSRHELEGSSVAEIAAVRGQDDFETAFDLLVENDGRVGMVFFTIGDEDLERIMKHPAVMVASDSEAMAVDGPLRRGKPHPRCFGTFVRVLGHYVREKGVISLEQAVHKMTAMPARKLRLYDRGLLRPGMKADVVIFDPERVGDCATFDDPFQYARGVDSVFVNGELTISDGRHLGVTAGRVLRNCRR